MKKRIFPICLSFLISAAYVASGIYFVSCVIKNPGPNYAMLWIPQAVFSAADYAVLGVLLCWNKADKIAVTVIAAIAFFFAIGPLAFILMSFMFFLMFPFSFEIFLLFFAPILLCAFPFVLAGIQISKSSRIKNI